MPLEETVSHGSVQAEEHLDAIEPEDRRAIPSSNAPACYHYRVREPSDVGCDEIRHGVRVSLAKLAGWLSGEEFEARRSA